MTMMLSGLRMSAFATRRLGFQRMPEELFCDPEDTLREFE